MDEGLCDGVRILLKEAAGVVAANGLGVIQQDGSDHALFTYVDAFGATGYRSTLENIPSNLRPTQPYDRATAIALDIEHLGLVETRLFHSGFSPQAQSDMGSLQDISVQQVIAQSIPSQDVAATLVVGLRTTEALSAAQIADVDRLARKAADWLARTPSPEELQRRSRRLEAVAKMLPALFRVLDVREIFDQLSTIAKDVLRHDFATVGLYTEGGTKLVLYVQTEGGPFEFRSGPMPFPTVQTEAWLYRFVDELSLNPLEGRGESVKGGGRSSIRVAVRRDDTILGALNFTSRDPTPYDATDLAVCRRVAEYVGLALSHQRLAEEARLNEALRARAANLELLDELLATVGAGTDHDQFLDRVSSLARKVLHHDAVIELPAAAGAADWDVVIIDDLTTVAGGDLEAIAAQGFRSALHVPIRLDGAVAASLAFVSRTSAAFKADDAAVARRIADRVALSVAGLRGREAARRADEATARASSLESRVRALTEELDARTGVRRLVGESSRWRQALTQATQVAPTETTVLLLGESGTGKEVVARFLHRASNRTGRPFVALNCAALPEQLLEAELFGYERGAFTSATHSKPGQLETAAGGTLFLDEVAEMSPSAQAKFLRVIQEREFQRLGGTRVLRTDARIIAATNRDLRRAIGNGQFREDLYYRLNVFAIQLPPLRDRRDDILPLTDAFLAEIGRSLGRPPAGISRDARRVLTDYHWPGNVRELHNILERAAILCEGGLITADHLAIAPVPSQAEVPDVARAASSTTVTSAVDLQSLERGMVEQALHKARFNKSKAAKALGLTRQQLYVRMRRYGLE